MILWTLRKGPFKWYHQFIGKNWWPNSMDYSPWPKAEKWQIMAPTKFKHIIWKVSSFRSEIGSMILEIFNGLGLLSAAILTWILCIQFLMMKKEMNSVHTTLNDGFFLGWKFSDYLLIIAPPVYLLQDSHWRAECGHEHGPCSRHDLSSGIHNRPDQRQGQAWEERDHHDDDHNRCD